MNDRDRQIDTLTGLFQTHYGLVLAAARRYAPVADDCDDVVQQVYVEFVSGALQGKLDTERNVGPLLFQIAKRRAQNLFRQRRDRQSGNIDELAEYLMSAEAYSEETREEIDRKIELLHRCLEKLLPGSRDIFQSHYFEDIPIKELARRLRKTPETLHRFFSRIRKKLRDCINASPDD